jgi:hypothetical protein
MIRSMRRSTVSIIIFLGIVTLSAKAWSQTAPNAEAAPPVTANVPKYQWKATDRSMLDLVEEGYSLVSVMAVTPGSHTYFLSKPGMIAKCEEQSTIISPPPPPIPSQRGQAPTFVPDDFVPETEVDIECAELARYEGPQQSPPQDSGLSPQPTPH